MLFSVHILQANRKRFRWSRKWGNLKLKRNGKHQSRYSIACNIVLIKLCHKTPLNYHWNFQISGVGNQNFQHSGSPDNPYFKYREIPLFRPPKMKTSYLLKTLFAKLKLLFSSFSTLSVTMIRDHLWNRPKVVFKTTFGQLQRWS